MTKRRAALGAALAMALAVSPAALRGAEQATKGEDGKYMTKDGVPTYRVAQDGTVDWYTFSGFRRYHSDCHVCHGPDGEGSTYAPGLVEPLKKLTYEQFMDVVVNGRQKVSASQQTVMPGFAENPNVMCYIDDLYVYLKARADGALPRGRPAKREDKTQQATKNENSCNPGG
jgi:methanol metabolism-related c-type cytochrome